MMSPLSPGVSLLQLQPALLAHTGAAEQVIDSSVVHLCKIAEEDDITLLPPLHLYGTFKGMLLQELS